MDRGPACAEIRQAGGLWASDTVTNYYNTARMRVGLGLQQPTGAWTNGFTYDGGHRLATVISPAGTFTYSYKGPGNLVTNLSLPNGSRITNAFDTVGRLTSTRLLTSGDSLLNSYAYIYNLAGHRTNLTRTDGNRVTNTYDNIGQLQSARGSGGQSTENLGYLYDTAWNLNKRTNNGTPTTLAVDVKNQLTSVGGYTCVYDNNGNLTSRQTGASTYVYYSYDDENQLASVTTDTYGTPTGSRWKSEFTYDGRGRLRKRVDYTWNTYPPGSWQVSGETRYVYDGMRVIQERSSANTPTVAYTRGNDLSGSMEGAGGIGGLLARSHGYSGGAFSTHNFYHADGNGNVTALVDSAQASAASYRYNPYGGLLGSSGGMAGANVYRFSSKEFFGGSLNLYYYGYRFYDPNLQRWLTRDPVFEQGGVNLYAFVDNRPVSGVDHLGLTLSGPTGARGAAKAGCAAGIALGVLRGEQMQPSPRWRYAHCMASCLIARACGQTTAKVAGFAKEVIDLLKCSFSLGTDKGACGSAFQPSDFQDNKRGREGVSPGYW